MTVNIIENPTVTIIIPCFNEKNNAYQFFESLRDQICENNIYEILVADGISDDGTRLILQNICKENRLIRVIDNANRFVSHGLNMAVKEARGDIIIRMDMHTSYASDYVKNCVELLQSTGAKNVGGAARTKASGYIQRANCIAFASKFSVGGAKFHAEEHEGYVDTVPYGCWWKQTLLDIGLFDERLIRNQDDELNYRLVKNGGKIWQSSKIKSWYYPRATIGGIFTQYFQYGYWKVQIFKKHKSLSSWRQLVPALFILSILYFGFAGILSSNSLVIFYSLTILYLTINLLISVFLCFSKKNAKYMVVLPIIFMMYHFGYGSGYIFGLISLMFPKVAVTQYLTRSTR